MIQRFVELGGGFGDVDELCALLGAFRERLLSALIFHSEGEGTAVLSLAVAFRPAGSGSFFPIYICGAHIPDRKEAASARLSRFLDACAAMGIQPVHLTVKHPSAFAEPALYYQYLTGILRLHRLIPPLS